MVNKKRMLMIAGIVSLFFIGNCAENPMKVEAAQEETLMSKSSDIDGDGNEESITVYEREDAYGYWTVSVSVDGKEVFSKQITDEQAPVRADFMVCDITGEGKVMYLRVYRNVKSENYCGLLTYANGAMEELTTMDELVNNYQTYQERSGHDSYFTIGTRDKEQSNLQLQINVNSASIKDFVLDIDYLLQDGDLKQTSYLSDYSYNRENKKNNLPLKDYTLGEEQVFYKSISDKKEAFSLTAMETIAPEKVWLEEGILWIYGKDKQDNYGWMPLGAGSKFLELTWEPHSLVAEKIAFVKEHPEELEIKNKPDAEILLKNGNSCMEAGAKNREAYKDAMIYYSQVPEDSKYFSEAEKKYYEAKDKICEKLFNEIQSRIDAHNLYEAYILLMENKDVLQDEKFFDQYMILCENNSSDEIVRKEEILKTMEAKKEEILSELQKNYQQKEVEMQYFEVKQPNDCYDLLIRLKSPYEEVYKYQCYEYSVLNEYKQGENELQESDSLEETLYYWEDAGKILKYAGTEDGILHYEAYDPIKKVNDIYTEYNGFPEVVFKDMEGSGNANVQESRKNDVPLIQYFLSKADDEWEYEDSVCNLSDYDNDGENEMVVRNGRDLGWDFYVYDCQDGQVVKLGKIHRMYRDFFYSKEDHALVDFNRSSNSNTYTYNIISGTELVEKFRISYFGDSLSGIRVFTYTENENKTEMARTDFDDPMPEIWNNYVNELEAVQFSTYEEMSGQYHLSMEETSENNADEIEVTLTSFYKDSMEYGNVEARDSNGTLLWCIQTDGYTAAQCSQIDEIGKNGDAYYFKEGRILYKVNLYTGEKIWGTECTGAIAENASLFTDDGKIYMTAYLSPDFMVYDTDGNQLKVIRSFEGYDDYYNPYKLISSNGKIGVVFENYPSGEGDTIWVNPVDYSYSKEM